MTELDLLTGPATFTAEGGSPDTARPLYGRELTASLKAALRAAFPDTTFSVRESRGTGAGWFRVKWTDGPTYRAVMAVAGRYQSSYFDGSIDGYREARREVWQDGGEWVTGSARGVNGQRGISDAEAAARAEALAAYYGWQVPAGSYNAGDWYRQRVLPALDALTWRDAIWRDGWEAGA